ncbi:MAG: 3'-5' exonuclease [Spirochaetales bacterium]|nr:3'-5' exonuclease [Spirochaetales bacterium]
MSYPWTRGGPGTNRNYSRRPSGSPGGRPASRRLSQDELDTLYTALGRGRFVALDVETTGLSAASERVVEICALRFSLRRQDTAWLLEPGDEFERLVNPGRPMPDAAQAIHGISDLDVSGAPGFSELAPALAEFLGDDPLVAHNAPFDLGFLAAEFGRAGLAVPANPGYDTLVLARTAVPHLPSYSLVSLVFAFGVHSDGAHRAGWDTRACMEVFHRCVSLLYK